ncbi:ABC-2 type transporter-domain-containing protein [Phascolomyces articulosus]|uniref:ABC-2 type transporter-domain-containing protein n=1 Tax=Phascolomyces articulosus TaxID=60185 RepID=A0AAD5KCC4_9FUNG|nr:ABC-2 type transporter-domain-containing protein [Phascolomyces articulosus]
MDEEKLKVDNDTNQNGEGNGEDHPDLEAPPRSSYTGTAETYVEPECGVNDTYGETDANQVDVNTAINQYHDLKRELTTISRKGTRRRPSITHEERGETAPADEFNLTEYLSGINESAGASGIKFKRLGIIWKDLVVKGWGADANTIPTNINVIGKISQPWKLLGIGKKGSKKTILKNLTGFVKEGEMLLVLGRPGSGCTSFLKILANVRQQYTDVDGDVSYGGIDAVTFGKHYRGQVVYNEEEDQHYPTLTTKQTLQFALRCKTPGHRLPDETKKVFVQRVIYLLGNMLGLTKQMNTMVGNAFIRGLSGGERKRLSIAEVMTTLSSINCWDCSTRGLDAASALDYVRSLRIMTDIFKETTVSTLYQASNSIYKLFDRVLVLDDGYCIYFGPAKLAKEYFENLGFHCPMRKSIPDFLTGLCNPLEREIKPGFEETAPRFSSEFEKRYLESKIYQDMLQDLEKYEQVINETNPSEDFAQAVRAEHQKRAPKRDPYTSSFYQQVKALISRQFHLQLKDRQALISRYGTILIQGLITASCFFKMPQTATGAFSRGGAIFFSLLFNAFISQSELSVFMTGRPILEKHKHFAMYRAGAFYLAQVILDVPYAIVQVLLYEICAYFMMGLNLNAGRFFTFFIVLFFINLMMNGFFRFFGSISTNWYMATQITGALLISIVTYTGYVIPYPTMHPWLYWIYWMNPLGYGYQALIKNEMAGQIYSCEGPGNAIPYGPGYNWPYKVCTMKGGNPGENFVLGDDYLWATFSYKTSYRWAPDFVVVVAYFLLFTAMTALAMDYLHPGGTGSLTKLYLPGKAPKARTNEEEDERLRRQEEVTNQMKAAGEGTTFSWHHMNYTVPFKGGPLHLLNDISGIVKPGHLTALMGSSGAGKTTLLDVLSKRKTIGKVEGRVYLNNEALMSDFERITGYCEQMDVHQPAVTVREAMKFSAYLRQDKNVPDKEKDDYVEQIITLLEMEDIADAQVGDVDSGAGISVEERKRLTIALELVSKPKLLFLDEPTSGLDAQSSYNIVRFIRKLADAGWPVLCTIHQPSAILFEHFDHLMLLVRGGRTAYYGEIGKDSRTMIDYFEARGGPICPPEANPAEYILEVVGSKKLAGGKDVKDWAEIWQESDEAKALEEELEEIHQNADMNPQRVSHKYATGLWYQFWMVHKRMALAYWRSPGYNMGRFFTCMFISLLIGFTYWKMSYTTSDMQNRAFVLLATFLMAQNLIILAQPKFMTERLYFQRDYASRYYSFLPFGFTSILVEIPYCIFFSTFFMFGFYWTAGLSNTSEQVGYFFIFMVIFVFWAVTFGFLIAAVSRTHLMASVINPLFISMLILFAGLMQPPQSMPYFWRSWMYWLNPFHYYIEGLTVNEMMNLPVICNQRDMVVFDPPPGQTCGGYMANYLANPGSTGYIDNPEATSQCNYCQFSSGKEYYTTMFQWSEKHRWRNFGILICYFAFNTMVFQLLVYLTRKPRR